MSGRSPLLLDPTKRLHNRDSSQEHFRLLLGRR